MSSRYLKKHTHVSFSYKYRSAKNLQTIKRAKQASFTATAGKPVCTAGFVVRTEWSVEYRGHLWLNFTNRINDLLLHMDSSKLLS